VHKQVRGREFNNNKGNFMLNLVRQTIIIAVIDDCQGHDDPMAALDHHGIRNH
jgi:hypothetical protein